MNITTNNKCTEIAAPQAFLFEELRGSYVYLMEEKPKDFKRSYSPVLWFFSEGQRRQPACDGGKRCRL